MESKRLAPKDDVAVDCPNTVILALVPHRDEDHSDISSTVLESLLLARSQHPRSGNGGAKPPFIVLFEEDHDDVVHSNGNAEELQQAEHGISEPSMHMSIRHNTQVLELGRKELVRAYVYSCPHCGKPKKLCNDCKALMKWGKSYLSRSMIQITQTQTQTPFKAGGATKIMLATINGRKQCYPQKSEKRERFTTQGLGPPPPPQASAANDDHKTKKVTFAALTEHDDDRGTDADAALGSCIKYTSNYDYTYSIAVKGSNAYLVHVNDDPVITMHQQHTFEDAIWKASKHALVAHKIGISASTKTKTNEISFTRTPAATATPTTKPSIMSIGSQLQFRLVALNVNSHPFPAVKEKTSLAVKGEKHNAATIINVSASIDNQPSSDITDTVTAIDVSAGRVDCNIEKVKDVKSDHNEDPIIHKRKVSFANAESLIMHSEVRCRSDTAQANMADAAYCDGAALKDGPNNNTNSSRNQQVNGNDKHDEENGGPDASDVNSPERRKGADGHQVPATSDHDKKELATRNASLLESLPTGNGGGVSHEASRIMVDQANAVAITSGDPKKGDEVVTAMNDVDGDRGRDESDSKNGYRERAWGVDRDEDTLIRSQVWPQAHQQPQRSSDNSIDRASGKHVDDGEKKSINHQQHDRSAAKTNSEDCGDHRDASHDNDGKNHDCGQDDKNAVVDDESHTELQEDDNNACIDYLSLQASVEEGKIMNPHSKAEDPSGNSREVVSTEDTTRITATGVVESCDPTTNNAEDFKSGVDMHAEREPLSTHRKVVHRDKNNNCHADEHEEERQSLNSAAPQEDRHCTSRNHNDNCKDDDKDDDSNTELEVINIDDEDGIGTSGISIAATSTSLAADDAAVRLEQSDDDIKPTTESASASASNFARDHSGKGAEARGGGHDTDNDNDNTPKKKVLYLVPLGTSMPPSRVEILKRKVETKMTKSNAIVTSTFWKNDNGIAISLTDSILNNNSSITGNTNLSDPCNKQVMDKLTTTNVTHIVLDERVSLPAFAKHLNVSSPEMLRDILCQASKIARKFALLALSFFGTTIILNLCHLVASCILLVFF
jgi:hypothetical protein